MLKASSRSRRSFEPLRATIHLSHGLTTGQRECGTEPGAIDKRGRVTEHSWNLIRATSIPSLSEASFCTVAGVGFEQIRGVHD